MKPFILSQNRIRRLFLCLSFIALVTAVHAQNLNGVKIQVAADALTYLQFNSDIKRFEFGGDREDYTGQVVENNQLRIKTLNNNPTPTNLVVNEGSRTHMFIIQVIKKIDINNFKSYYNYADLKLLKKLASSGNTEAIASAGGPDVPQEKATQPQAEKTDKKSQRQIEKDRKAREEQDRKDALAQQKEKEEADRKLAQAEQEKQEAKERDSAAIKEKERLKQEAVARAKEEEAERKRLKAEQALRDKEATAAKAREQQLAKEKQQEEALLAKRAADEKKQQEKAEQARKAREAQRDKDIAAAKEKDRQAAIAKADAQRRKEAEEAQQAEQARQAQLNKEKAAAQEKERQREAEHQRAIAAEKERQKQEEIARKREEALEKERIRREEAIQQQQLAQERERQRQEEAARKAAIAKEEARVRQEQREADEKRRREERADALIKNPYWKSEWRKKYPQVNFAEPPVGQQIAGEYYLPKDTMYNSNVAALVLNEATRLNKLAAEEDGVQLKLERITFNGVNAYLRLRIINESKKDFLVGKMQLTWWKKEGGGYYLNPAYVTNFPVVAPGSEATIVFACHGVNATDKDEFSFSMAERLSGTELKIPFNGAVYNKEMNRK